ADKNNFIYTTANTYQDTVIIGNDTLINQFPGSSVLLVKYTPEGEIEWATIFGSSDNDYGTNVIIDGFGNIYNAGYFYSDTIIFSEDTLYNTQNDNNEVYFLRAGNCNTYKPVISFNDHNLLAPSAESYQWYFNNNIIDGATSAIYEAWQEGTYTVICFYAQACYAASQRFSFPADLPQNALIIYPNPSSGNFFLQTPLYFNEVKIYNAAGELIYKTNNLHAEHEFTILSNGIYMVQALYGNEFITKKVVIY
ncbi:MAG: T9SS type A sorting domain-containing protein, partial [Fimbriimonadaceae bacterium]|nr:T9SS type A sorting domain-containing protein [Chitinophagales bacterium]